MVGKAHYNSSSPLYPTTTNMPRSIKSVGMEGAHASDRAPFALGNG